MISRPRLWITYAWADNEGGDFSYLVQELQSVGVDATFDRVALVTGRDLWAQIGDHIASGPIDGWAYLVTPNSLGSNACREELAYALGRVLSTKGRDFALLGLLHGVRFSDLPPALKVRLCISLATPNWKEEVKSGLQNRPPEVPIASQPQFVWRNCRNFGGIPNSLAVEIRPRFGEIMYWRIVVPASAPIIQWGYGPAGGGPLSGVQTQVVEGTANVNGVDSRFFGAGDRLSPAVSAYVVFAGTLPAFVGFSVASEPFGALGQIEICQFRS